jgi:hypothetical protein
MKALIALVLLRALGPYFLDIWSVQWLGWSRSW